MFPFTSIYQANLAGTVFSFLLCYQTTMGLGHSFLPEKDAADELARQGALLVPSAISFTLCLFISRIRSCLFLDWRSTVSSKFFDTHRFPRFSPRNLYYLVTLAVPSLVLAATDTASSEAPITLGWAESRILNAAPADIRPRTFLILILHCPATDSLHRSLFGDCLSIYDL